MREFAERYYREVVARDRKDARNMRRYLDNEILPALGGKNIVDVTATEVQTLVFRKRDNGQEAAAAAMRNLIKRIFDYAVVCGATQINPAFAECRSYRRLPRLRARSFSQFVYSTVCSIGIWPIQLAETIKVNGRFDILHWKVRLF
jgi:site-specific recombinase XerC